MRALSAISKKHNIVLAVDNCVMTPALQTPLALGADIVIHSATKYIDGQGRCLAGAIAGSTVSYWRKSVALLEQQGQP